MMVLLDLRCLIIYCDGLNNEVDSFLWVFWFGNFGLFFLLIGSGCS